MYLHQLIPVNSFENSNFTNLFIGLELDAGLQVLEHDQQLDQNVTPAPKEALISFFQCWGSMTFR
jgi:hypothetical protein